MQLRRHGKSFARTLLHKAGALSGVRYWNRSTFRILMYHDFPTVPGLQESLEKQCAHIKRHYEIVSMTDIAHFLRDGKSLPKNALAVTVDDGNRDFFVNGYPVFNAYKIPVTTFLVSGFLDGHLWLWWDKIRYVIEESKRPSFELALVPGRPPLPFGMATLEQREQAIATITQAMKYLSESERREVLDINLTKALDVEIPHEPPLHMAPMSWSEVREIMDKGFEFGAHTVTHPVLSSVHDPQELFREIELSKRRMEEELQRPVLHFCYPYGHWKDFNEQTVNVLERCQFQTAVTAQHGLNVRKTNPFKLTRLSVEPMLPEFYFRERLAGAHAG
jgi:peptidoglycan/xylan/chitin deacetylase (PgdA/CDA1 family)